MMKEQLADVSVVGLCRLCLQLKPLRDSHLLAAALYRFMREPGDENPDPIFVTPKQARQTSNQVKDFVFCGDCEDRFSKGGETWVLRNCYRASGEFHLHDYAHEIPIARGKARLTRVAAVSNPKIRMDSLTYFAASIFWRASIHPWRFQAQPMDLPQLGATYDEQLRQYLLGEADFPVDAVLYMGITESKKPQLICSFPVGGRDRNHHTYSFWIPGVSFTLFLSQGITGAIRAGCSVRSPERWLYISDQFQERLLEGAVPLIRKSKPTRKLDAKYPVGRNQ